MNNDIIGGTIGQIAALVAVLAALGSVGFATYAHFVMRRLKARGELPPPHPEVWDSAEEMWTAAQTPAEGRRSARKPLRDGVERLPDGRLRYIRPARSLPVVAGDPDQLCRTCARWDLDEGQAMARQHGPFMIAAQYVPPSEMGAVATPGGEIEARDIPAKATWAEFGLCHLRHEGIWGNTDAARRARMQDDSGVPGQFLEDGVDCYTTEGP